MTARGLWVLVGILILGLLLVIGTRREARSEPVSSAIVMLVDYSSSMVASERQWQRDGLAAVMGDASIEQRIEASARGAVMVTVVAFAAKSHVVIPWMVLRPGDGSVAAFRQAVANMSASTRDVSDGTNIAQALVYAGALLDGVDADRRIVDLQTDGTQGEAPGSLAAIASLEAARDALGQAGIIVNVLVMGAPQQSSTDLAAYHWRHTATGLVWMATELEAYLKALQVKLLLELG